jgi:hypothetical protein
MNHQEDEQPNETVHGRPKHILPFVKNTSRDRGRGRGRGNLNRIEVGCNEGRGHSRGVLLTAGISFRGSNTPGSTHDPVASESSKRGLYDTLNNGPPIKPPSSVAFQRFEAGAAAGPSKGGPHLATHTTPKPPRPRRRRFRPGKNKHKNDNRPLPANDSESPVRDSSNDPQLPPYPVDSLHPALNSPPTKRPRLKENLSTGCISSPPAAFNAQIKAESENEFSVDLFQGRSTRGTEFIPYDNYPMCRFDCGKPLNEVRSNRRLAKEQEVLALRKVGKEVNAVFIRDDGIAIDWSLPTEREGSGSIGLASPATLQEKPESAVMPNSALASLQETGEQQDIYLGELGHSG